MRAPAELQAMDRATLARWGRSARPLIGGAVGLAVVVGFLALRGGEADEGVNAITGTQRGGWNREEDFHLALVVGGAATAGLMAALVAEWVRRWWALGAAVVAGWLLLLIREAASIDGAGADALLALVFFCVFLAVAAAAYDVVTLRRRTGY